jgi:hypothetical protein
MSSQSYTEGLSWGLQSQYAPVDDAVSAVQNVLPTCPTHESRKSPFTLTMSVNEMGMLRIEINLLPDADLGA